MGIFDDIKCTAVKFSPLFWEVAAGLGAAKVAGAIKDRNGCKAFGKDVSGEAAKYGIPSGLSDTFLECACEMLFDEDAPRPPSVWKDWEGLGGGIQGAVGAVATSHGIIDVYVRGMDNTLYQKTWLNNHWEPGGTEWNHLDGSLQLGSSPTVVSLGPSHRDVYVRGADGAVHHKAWDGGKWQDWKNIGGQTKSSVGAVATSEGTIDVYIQGLDGTLYQKTWLGDDWEPRGAEWFHLDANKFSSAPVVVSLEPQHRDVYVMREDRTVWHKAWT